SQYQRTVLIKGAVSFTAIFTKEVKVVLATQAGGKFGVFDSSWRVAGGRTTLRAPEIEGYLFNYWSMNGRAVGGVEISDLPINEPALFVANYSEVTRLSVQSDWSSGFPFRIDDSAAVTPFKREYPLGSRVTVSFAENSEVDVSPFVEGGDVMLRARFKDGMPSGPRSRTIRIDSAENLTIA